MNTVTTQPWPAGAGTGIGSMPGTDPAEAAAVVLGELPEFSHLPELPARGVGADPVGRTAALLVDLATELVPTGYRVAATPGRDHRRAVDLLRWDLDGIEAARQHIGMPATVIKTQFTGPWSFGASVELARGHRVLTDHGALREFTESLLEGLAAHVGELATRSGASVVVQLDEPLLASVLAGSLPTPSGYDTVPSVPEPEARALLSSVIARVAEVTGSPVIVRCDTPRPPVAVLRGAGAGAIALDATRLDGAPPRVLDEIGEAWEEGTVFLLGLVPARGPEQAEPTGPAEPSPGSTPGAMGLYDVASPALRLVDRLGFNRTMLAELAVPTPTAGLAGASAAWMRTALRLTRDLGKAFVEPPESW